MFEDACKLYWSSQCMIGGGTETQKGVIHGMGCTITPSHVITARHVVTKTASMYDWLVVGRHDGGLYISEVVFESVAADIVLLKAVKKIDEAKLSCPDTYPEIYSKGPFLGLSVGYLGGLHLNEADGTRRRYTHFSQASLSMFLESQSGRSCYMALSGGIIQKGFSGGPVFNMGGDLLGVITDSLQFTLDEDHPVQVTNTVPVMSSLHLCRDDINRTIGLNGKV